ncbi:MAG TPA: VOC family protein [Myxococcota bacterium]|nr:VOC family protein [Myxococcota bacterium]
MGSSDGSRHPVAIVGSRIDHAHCYVRDLEGAVGLFTRVLGIQFTAPFDLEGMRLCTSRLGIEIAAPTAPGSPIRRTLELAGGRAEQGIFRLCLVVEDLPRALAHFRSRGLRIFREIELPGIAHEIQFDPRDSFGIALQLGVWGPRLAEVEADGLRRGAAWCPAPVRRPLAFLEERIDHVHCRVDDLDAAIAFFTDLLGTPFTAPYAIEAWQTRVSISSIGMELNQVTGVGPIHAAEIAERGPRHVARLCFSLTNLDEAVAHCESLGLRILRRIEIPEIAREVQLDPRDSCGIGLQLGEWGPRYREVTRAGLAAGARGADNPLRAAPKVGA